MKDKIEWTDIQLMDYLKKMETLCLPSMEEYEYSANIRFVDATPEEIEAMKDIPFKATECMIIFRERYNQGLFKRLSYDQYVKNELIQQFITDLELNKDKFWILILFLTDYCESMFRQGKTMKLNPFEQLEQLVKIIEEHAENMILSIKAGKIKATIDDPNALRTIYNALFAYVENGDQEQWKYLSRRIKADEDTVLKDSPLIAYFANKLLRFFDCQPQIKAKRKKGANHSIKETDLVCQLIYFTRLSYNDSWLLTENENLKAFLKQYKNHKYPNNKSSVYPEFVC